MRSRQNRRVRFELERGSLVRHVELADGRSYTHRCTLEAFQEVACYVEGHAKDSVTTGELWEALALITTLPKK
jgi:hypothetical protein